MVITSKKEYLEEIRPRYEVASKKEKSKILSEFCAICSYHHKHAIRLLRREKAKTKPGKRAVYDPRVLLKPLKTIWLVSDQMCSRKLKVALPIWLPFYEQEHGVLDKKVSQQLLSYGDLIMPTLNALSKFL